MTLEKDLTLLDSKGVIPERNETPEKYIDRAVRIIKGSDISDIVAYAQMRLKTEGGFRRRVVFPNSGDKRVIARAVKNIDGRFGCDFSWLTLCYADMGLGDGLPRGYTFATRKSVTDGEVKYEPPLIVVNSAILGKKGTYLHELIHMPLQISGYDDGCYKGWRSYEQRLANEATISRKAISALTINPKVNFEFAVVKHRLRQAFGSNDGYVLIRTPHEEARDFYFERTLSKDPKEVICIRAEKGDTRYQIMKQRLKL